MIFLTSFRVSDLKLEFPSSFFLLFIPNKHLFLKVKIILKYSKNLVMNFSVSYVLTPGLPSFNLTHIVVDAIKIFYF